MERPAAAITACHPRNQPILRSAKLKRSVPLFDSLLSLSASITDQREEFELLDSAVLSEQTYELEDGSYKPAPPDVSLLLPNRKQSPGSIAFAILNFTNSILGAGLMGLPYALMQSGLVLGILLLVLVTIVVDWSIILLIRSGRLACASSYQELMSKAFGPVGSTLCSIFQVIFAVGGMCAYMIILADNASRVGTYFFPESLLAERSFVILFTTFAIILPLSLAKDLNFLGNFSLLAILSVLFMIVAIITETSLAGHSHSKITIASPRFIEAIGIISFAFVCHHNSFEIHDSLEIPSLKVFTIVTHVSTGFSLLASILLAVPAYLYFAQETQANILNNFSMDSLVINLARIMLAFSLMLTYPLDCFVAREVLTTTIFGHRASNWIHYAITSLLVGITLAVSLGYTNLEIVLELTGGLAASALAFIFPAACYLRLAPSEHSFHSGRFFAKVLLLFGILVLLASCGSTFHRIL